MASNTFQLILKITAFSAAPGSRRTDFTFVYKVFTTLLPLLRTDTIGLYQEPGLLCFRFYHHINQHLMRSILFFVCALLCLTGAIACRDRSAAAIVAPTLAITEPAPSTPVGSVVGYSLVIPESFVNWKGTHVIGGNGHQGFIKPLTGTLVFDANGAIVGGYFELDMNTITLTDKKDTSSDNGVVSHLKDPDFFDVKKYPKGTFQLTKAIKASGDSSYNITGQLTLRAITQEIQFPATIVRNGDDVVATASLTIDRTKWGITYQSGSILGLVKEELLEDRVPVSLALRFHQQ
jgi:polyisoprenoid-binding protein YceI